MKFLRTFALPFALALAFTVTPSVHAEEQEGNPDEITDIGGLDSILGGGSLEDVIFNAAYLYASNDPQYAPILKALNINSGADLKKFLLGDKSGANQADIANHLSFEYAKKSPDFEEWFRKVGIKDEPSLRAYKNGVGKKHATTLDKMALSQARSDENYQEWLDQLGIENLGDFQDILNGDGGNLFQNIWPLAKQYILTNYPEYARYLTIVESLLGLDSGDDSPEEEAPEEELPEEDIPEDEFEDVDPPEEILGSYRGLSNKEVMRIRIMRNKKAPPNGSLLD